MNPTEGICPIIGMSPGNSYFTEEVIENLIKKIVGQFGRTAVFIPDIPAIATYKALGYPENVARRDKAIPKGNNLKNKVLKAIEKNGFGKNQVRIIDWEKDAEENIGFQKTYEKIKNMYEVNADFKKSVNDATRSVLQNMKDDRVDDLAVSIGAHYLLSELAFMEQSPVLLGANKTIYVYHKPWLIYESYIAGKFDGVFRKNLGFLVV